MTHLQWNGSDGPVDVAVMNYLPGMTAYEVPTPIRSIVFAAFSLTALPFSAKLCRILPWVYAASYLGCIPLHYPLPQLPFLHRDGHDKLHLLVNPLASLRGGDKGVVVRLKP